MMDSVIFPLPSGSFTKTALSAPLHKCSIDQARVCPDPAPNTAAQGHALHLPAAGGRQLSTNPSHLNNITDVLLNAQTRKLQPIQTFSCPGQDRVPHYTHLSGLLVPERDGKGSQHECAIASEVLTGYSLPSSCAPTGFI